jgi:putative ABC transport system ATP-binding protein
MSVISADAPEPGLAASVVETHALSKVYSPGTEAEVIALKHVNLRVTRGDFVAIMGPSGSGKSTLMNLIGCLDTPTEGSYRCDGVDVSTLGAEELAILRRDKIGFVFQGFNLLSRMNALENVAMPLVVQGFSRYDTRRKVTEALRAVGVEHRKESRPETLSAERSSRARTASALGWRGRGPRRVRASTHQFPSRRRRSLRDRDR